MYDQSRQNRLKSVSQPDLSWVRTGSSPKKLHKLQLIEKNPLRTRPTRAKSRFSLSWFT